MRIGNGYDIHRLVPGRPLILGGIPLPYDKGLLGHSDADVLTHAIMDALLGACALGDIGHYFPPGDPQWAGADSQVLLRQVTALVQEQGWQIGNVDAVVIAEAPKLKPYLSQIRQRLAETMGIPVNQVSVKATTNETLDAVGAGEGIAAYAVALLVPAS
jgi:2-C-methyl-D-erythritol 2,4-cyclodiphosphate synthase